MDLIKGDRIVCLLTGMAIPVVLFVGLVMWTGEETEEFDLNSDITVEISCRDVLQSPDVYPDEAVAECRGKFQFLRAPVSKTKVLI